MRRILTAPLMLLLAVVLGVAAGLPSGYFVLHPGGSYEVGSRLEIPVEQREEMGHLAFTAVLAGPGSWGEVVMTWLDPAAEVVPAEQLRPHGVSQQEVNELNARLINESKLVAAVVGLRAAGHDARITGEGARVVDVLAGMPAAGVLQAGDLIVAVDGRPTDTSIAVIQATRQRTVGDIVTLTIVRDGQRQEVRVGTRSAVDEPGRPVVGVAIATEGFDVVLPFPIEIDTGNVGGASAGLMFALGIFDAVTAGVLTRGHRVAGTGTISADGSVGPIGGAALKVVAAERDGADVFLVPRENYAEAQSVARSIRLVPVDRFEDAVAALCGVAPTDESADSPVPPVCTTPPFVTAAP
ncbi:MAG: PDZ domain-containing protein [Chloroflexota bacterium]|nr:PDZ domain-containing protein [Chloroflexota bacterium]